MLCATYLIQYFGSAVVTAIVLCLLHLARLMLLAVPAHSLLEWHMRCLERLSLVTYPTATPRCCSPVVPGVARSACYIKCVRCLSMYASVCTGFCERHCCVHIAEPSICRRSCMWLHTPQWEGLMATAGPVVVPITAWMVRAAVVLFVYESDLSTRLCARLCACGWMHDVGI